MATGITWFEHVKHASDEKTAYLEIPIENLSLVISTSEHALLTYPHDVSDHPLTRHTLDESALGHDIDYRNIQLNDTHDHATIPFTNAPPLEFQVDSRNPDLIHVTHASTTHQLDLEEIFHRNKAQNPHHHS